MSKFLDVLERIRDGVTAPLGFGATRAEKLPGIALVAHVSAGHAGGLEAAATADAVLVSGAAGPDGLKQLAESLTMPSGPGSLRSARRTPKPISPAAPTCWFSTLMGPPHRPWPPRT